MTTKKIFLKKYFDVFVISDTTLKESVGIGLYSLDEFIQDRIDEIKYEFIVDLKKYNPPKKNVIVFY